MGPFEAEIAAIVMGISGGITALALILRYRLRRRELELRPPGADDAAVDRLRDEVAYVRGQLTDLQERVDFAERLLAEGRTRSTDP